MAMMSAVHASDDFAHWALDKAWARAGEPCLGSTGRQAHCPVIHTGMDMALLLKPGRVEGSRPGRRGRRNTRTDATDAYEELYPAFDDFDSLTAALYRLNIAWGLVRGFGQEAYDQPSAKELGVLVDVDDDIGQTRQTVQSPYRFLRMESGLTAETRLARHGEDNHAALREWLGLNEDWINALTKNGVLVCQG